MQQNVCPLCGGSSHQLAKETRHDLFFCTSCGVRFEETGTGPRLQDAKFEIGKVYSATVYTQEGKVVIGFEVSHRKEGCWLVCLANSCLLIDIFVQTAGVDENVEFFRIPKSLPGAGAIVFPY